MKLTMKEIAGRAGVSPATVSRVLNGNADVTLEKRERVLHFIAAESEKDRWIRHRKKHKTRHIALLLLSGSRSDIRNVGSKIINIADQLPDNYEFQVCSSRVNAHRLESQFLHGELDGLLLSGHQVEDAFLSFLLEKIPHVWLNSFQLKGQQAVSLMGNEFAGKIAAGYLTGHHCRRPAVLSFINSNIGLADRISGFVAACFLQKVPCREIALKLSGGRGNADDLLQHGEAVETAVRAALDRIGAKDFPDGIFSPEEVLTPFLYRVFMQKKLKKYPRVISCNHTPGYLAGLYPRPASIDLHPETVVKLAIDELINRIEGGVPRPDNIAAVVQPQLIPGEDDLQFSRTGCILPD